VTILTLIAFAALVALFIRSPTRTLWGLLWGAAAVLLLAEVVGVRGAFGIGAVLTAVIALSGPRPRAAPAPPRDTPMTAAWTRLLAAGGFWSRNRIVVLKARYDAVAASTAECDPFSEAGAMRIKLERYIPELIGASLDDAARLPAAARRAAVGELLAELDRFVTRMEAVDPAGKLRADRRAALRNHLRSGDDPPAL
jgi:hypothetical protein